VRLEAAEIFRVTGTTVVVEVTVAVLVKTAVVVSNLVAVSVWMMVAVAVFVWVRVSIAVIVVDVEQPAIAIKSSAASNKLIFLKFVIMFLSLIANLINNREMDFL
jgi:hypothetical protein